MEGRLTAYDAAFEAQGDDDDDTPHTAPVLYLEDNRYDPARLVEMRIGKNKVHLLCMTQ